MTLLAGTKLGPHEILGPLRAGGMGEVYKARDTRLDRTVAIKVLPSHLADNPELKQRFEREARAISALSHPHICALYDVGSHEGTEYLVMELLEGQTLAQRLEKGSLPTEQVLRFSTEIADALDKAHRHGIVHRDLKPGNVMLTKSGVKLLDFGLAKQQAQALEREMQGLSSLPTEMPRESLTEQGTVLGTFQYMAPEQLEGKEVDARTDIFAFGAVLYEMATGKKAFAAKSRASMIAAILEHDPAPISSIQPMTPPALDRVVQTCLTKDPDDRWQSAHDVMSELKWIAQAGSQAGAPAAVVSRRKSRERVAWLLTVFLAVAFASGLWITPRSRRPSQPVTRSSINLPEGVVPNPLQDPGGPITISPDGTQVVLTALSEGRFFLWVCSLVSSEVRQIPGTENAEYPFWSPDGRSVGFFADGKLKTIDLTGGEPQILADATTGRGGSWNRDGTIVFAPTALSVLYRVNASGGTTTPVTRYEASRRGDSSHR